ncbi:hypothetical protein DL96DRAFT_1702993 [Flagelloscypha sp. PMI_526]|nr:hypothetical protein DL96DRAFT_1702993 [Flagelloscypha sp. PMI_526]
MPDVGPSSKPPRLPKTDSARSSQSGDSTPAKKRKKSKRSKKSKPKKGSNDEEKPEDPLFSLQSLKNIDLKSEQLESAMEKAAQVISGPSSPTSTTSSRQSNPKRQKKQHHPPTPPTREEGELLDTSVNVSFEDNQDFIAFLSEPEDERPEPEPEPYRKSCNTDTTKQEAEPHLENDVAPVRGLARARAPRLATMMEENVIEAVTGEGRETTDETLGDEDSTLHPTSSYLGVKVLTFTAVGMSENCTLHVSSLTMTDWKLIFVTDSLHKEVYAFTKYMSPSRAEDEVRSMVVTIIQTAIQTAFHDAQVLPFGSFSTKLYLPSGDIDLVIFSTSMSYSDKLSVLQRLAATLKRNAITHRVTILSKAKVPIVKFVTTQDLGAFNVDISVNQANGLHSLEVIKTFLGNEQNPGYGIALKALVLVTKQYLSQRSMNEVFTGGLGSYSIVCLAISFLQMHPKIRSGHLDPCANLGVLLLEFFELYGIVHNYIDVGISLQDGGKYYDKREKGWFDYYNDKRLSIEDPADDTNDISVGTYNYHSVRVCFAGAHAILIANCFNKDGIIGSRRRGRDANFDRRRPSAELSILGSILQLSQDTINHRRLVHKVWQSGKLQRMCGLPPPGSKPDVIVLDDDEETNTVTVTRDPSARLGVAVHDLSHEHGKESPKSEDANRGREESRTEKSPLSSSQNIRKEVSDDDEGRYGIGRRPPAKRRKLGKTSRDMHTYTAVSDSSDSDSDASGSSGSSKEDGEMRERKKEPSDDEVVLNIIDDARKDIEPSSGVESVDTNEDKANAKKELTEEERIAKVEKQKEKRDFWLSKGISTNTSDDGDSE